MNVLPRSSWTSHVVSPSKQADVIQGLETFRHPVGISFHGPLVRQSVERTNPVGIFEDLWKSAISYGHSDIDYNLGATGHGIYSLRGISNKSSASPDRDFNGSYVSTYLCIGTAEKPTDALLRNVLDARRLVLSRYPTATTVDFREVKNPWLQELFQLGSFWRDEETDEASPAYLPEVELALHQTGIHVQELQELLAYWGLYRKRVNGIFDVQTEDAVIDLQANLADGGYYHYDTDGVYSEQLRIAWMKYLNDGQK